MSFNLINMYYVQTVTMIEASCVLDLSVSLYLCRFVLCFVCFVVSCDSSPPNKNIVRFKCGGGEVVFEEEKGKRRKKENLLLFFVTKFHKVAFMG